MRWDRRYFVRCLVVEVSSAKVYSATDSLGGKTDGDCDLFYNSLSSVIGRSRTRVPTAL